MIARSTPRPRGLLAAGLAGGLLAALASAPTAQAYVRYKTSSGQPFAWKQTCVPLTYYPNTMIDGAGAMDMTPAEIDHAVQAAAAAWSSAANACSFLQINVGASTAPPPGAMTVAGHLVYGSIYDKRNSLLFQTRDWCGPKKNGACTYDSLALAITSVFVIPSDGTIRDTDIEINGVNFIWADLDPASVAGGNRQDLQNALTHEMGHMIGLDHTCYMPGDPTARATDDMGNPVPDCPTAPAAVRATTMFASADPGDTQKRTLAPDDTRAICDIYPVATDPLICPTADPGGSGGCGCSMPGRTGGDPALAVAAALLWRRRRRRRAPRPSRPMT
jgi:hypothetical protein